MNFYERLNNNISRYLDNPYFKDYLYYLDELAKLARIILENTPILNSKAYSESVSLNDSIQNVVDFFQSINPQYAYMFQNIMREQNEYDGKMDYSVRFYVGQRKYDSSRAEISGVVHIDYNNTLGDSFTIMHEMIHKFSQPRNQDSTIKRFLGEVSSITMEFLLEDYFMKDGKYPKEEIIKYKNYRLGLVICDAFIVWFENELLRLYRENNNCISQDVLINYFNSFDKSSEFYNLISKMSKVYFQMGGLHFHNSFRHVIGVILASFFHNKIVSNPDNIQLLFYLIDILGHTDLSFEEDMELLSKLDIPIINNGKVQITDDAIKQLTDCYTKEVSSVIQNNTTYDNFGSSLSNNQ